MKKVLVVGAVLASVLAGNLSANNCFKANDVCIDAFTREVLKICKEDYSIKLEYKKVHTKAKEVSENLTTDCFNSCRNNERPEDCMDRYKKNYVESAILEMRSTMQNICTNLKK